MGVEREAGELSCTFVCYAYLGFILTRIGYLSSLFALLLPLTSCLSYPAFFFSSFTPLSYIPYLFSGHLRFRFSLSFRVFFGVLSRD
jgi:hypothetical protein